MSLFNELFDRRSLYFDIFDRMVEAVYICDTDKNLIYFNKAAERLDGYLLKDVKGKSTYELYGLDDMDSPMLRALATEHPVVNEEFSYYVNGKELIQLCNSGPIYEEGRLIGAYTVQRDLTQFKGIVEQNIALQRVINDHKSKKTSPFTDPFSGIVGKSEKFRQSIALSRQAARTNSSVMLIGSTGSGKEVFARAIHESSNRAEKPFLALNCAAIPESLIEGILFGTTKGVYTGAVEKDGILAQADGGTVFLDEINSMPLISQAKLLRVLEEKKIMKLGSNKEVPINIRVISSINEMPAEAIRKGRLREDLFYRLSVVQILIPPLRDRAEDIPYLVRHFVEKYNARFGKNVLGVDSQVMSIFMNFPWPGNVRQLKACIESAMNFAKDDGWITRKDLPVYVFEDAEVPENRYRPWSQKNFIKASRETFPGMETEPPVQVSFPAAKEKPVSPPEETAGGRIMDSIRNEEKEEIIAALHRYRGNITKAAESLGMSRQSLSYRLKKYHLK